MGVPPFIPNAMIQEALKQYGKLKAEIVVEVIYGLPKEFWKIENFNPTLKISCDSRTRLPDKIKVAMNEREYVIFLQVGRKKCFKCGLILHISANCSGKKSNEQDPREHQNPH